MAMTPGTVRLENPTRQKLIYFIEQMLDSVQKDSRSRKVKVPEGYRLDAVLNEPEGIMQYNGGQPSKVDSSYATGQTSRLGIAWWTDRSGNKHVKIATDRTQASNFSVPEIFSLAQHPFSIIFSEFDPTYCRNCGYVIPPGEGYWREESWDCDSCVETIKYYLETGFLPPGTRKKKK